MKILAYVSRAVQRLNRAERVRRAIHALATSRQDVVYADIGSAGGIPPQYLWASRRGVLSIYLLDAQDDWRRIVDPNEYRGCNVRRIKAALGARVETLPFYITAAPGCSSCLPPNESILTRFPVREWFRVVERNEVTVRPYLDVHVEHGLRVPDIVKIDVQGLELSVLSGFGHLLDRVTCVELEVTFEQLYQGQPVISNIYEFMLGKGFVLRDLKPQGPFEGQAIEYNSYWSRQTLSAAQERIVDLWESIHDVWPGQKFAKIRESAERNVRLK